LWGVRAGEVAGSGRDKKKLLESRSSWSREVSWVLARSRGVGKNTQKKGALLT